MHLRVGRICGLEERVCGSDKFDGEKRDVNEYGGVFNNIYRLGVIYRPNGFLLLASHSRLRNLHGKM